MTAITEHLDRIYRGDTAAAREWLQKPLLGHDGATPQQLIDRGQVDYVRSWLDGIEYGFCI